jgi:hypothetical protein
MRALSVSWNAESDITRIHFNDNFKYSDWLIKMDVLKDVIGELSYHYDNLCSMNLDERKYYDFIDNGEVE